MTASNDTLWRTKVAARLHDPAEKALVLLRDPAGHENGTSRALSRLLGLTRTQSASVDADNDEALARTIFQGGIPSDMYRDVQHADWWAAAADRPQWPMDEITVDTRQGERTFKVASWAQVRWTNEPILVHPLTGEQLDLKRYGTLSDTDFKDIKARSFEHHARLLGALPTRASGTPDWCKTLLTLWRFAPELDDEDDHGHLGELWKMLPADTRIPDHSIWDHLDLTSAFAGAFSADPDGQVALLTLSIGPVQPFIAAARKMEDLWAGSHLLSRLAWEAMRVVCERFGPDAILFPRLRGVPQVDLWLRDQCQLPDQLFKDCSWNRGRSDSNPLFAAALPNRFVAVVPAAEAETVASAIEQQVRRWLQETGQTVLQHLLQAADIADDPALACHQQMIDQLAEFPEVHWAAVPFSLVGVANPDRQTGLNTTRLSAAMRPFFEDGAGDACGFLATPAWQLLKEELVLANDDGTRSAFFTPNPGVLYPAVYELAERALNAAKAARPFQQNLQTGWRETLGGEHEWLATDRAHLAVPASHRLVASDPRFNPQVDCETLWVRLAARKPAWARPGEHLGALAAVKRLWPTLFADEVTHATRQSPIGRFVVSTHTMALAHQLDQWLDRGGALHPSLILLLEQYRNQLEPVALPRKLVRAHAVQADALQKAALLPAMLDHAAEGDLPEPESRALRLAVARTLSPEGEATPETYYGMMLFDGDHMGAWLSGDEGAASEATPITYLESFHPAVQAGFRKHAAKQPVLRAYGNQPRALSPNRHLAISSALNDFSLTIARHVVEQEFSGRLIYAGGDDVLAMLPVADLLNAARRLRLAYSGDDPNHKGGREPGGLTLSKGFALLHGRLMRMMGTRATASCGLVVAHHQAPLAAVRRELAAAEQRAKHEGGRNAFSITIIKRSGGALRLTDHWGEPMLLLTDLRAFLQSGQVSRRAAYHTLEWLDDKEFPPTALEDGLLQALLGYQLERQSEGELKALAPALAERLTRMLSTKPQAERIPVLRNFIALAEFLAREIRSASTERAA